MYCPKCGSQNIEGAKFCRACGADIVAVLEQLTGRLPQDRDEHSRANAEQAARKPTAFADDEATGDAPRTGDPSWESMFGWMAKSPPRPPLAPMIKFGRIGDETGKLSGKRGRRKESKTKEAKIEDGIQSFFWGIGFLCVAIAIGLFMPGGRFWWFWMLLPAFGFMGGGMAEIVRARLTQRMSPSSDWSGAMDNSAQMPRQTAPHSDLNPSSPERSTSAIFQPPPQGSVTEGTTRHLDPRNPTPAASERPWEK